VFFGVLWFLVAYAHGDFDDGYDGPTCLTGTTTPIDFLLFSLEAQVTTGYGSRTPTEECPEALFLLFVQLLTAVVIDGAMLGIIFTKVAVPKTTKCEGKFSKNAVISLRDGKMCLVFQICDVKQLHTIESRVTATILTEEAIQIPLKLENNGNILLMWPNTICHIIDEDSPFYEISPSSLAEQKFEIVLTLLGGSSTTGQKTQARTSYLPHEILWGYRYLNLIKYDFMRECYTAINDHFDEVVPIHMPSCSAKIFYSVPRIIEPENDDECDNNMEYIDENVNDYDEYPTLHS
jgi:potassium inwardly-rectifying channel subfamily J